MERIEANARHRLGKLTSDQIVTLANEWLEAGVYTESLGELCTIVGPVMSEVGPLFESSMVELGVGDVTRIEAGRLLVQCTLADIAAGKVHPVAGAEALYWHVYLELSDELPDQKHVGDGLGLEYVFCWLREIWDCRDGSILLHHTDLPRDQAEVRFVEHLVEAARDWVSPPRRASPMLRRTHPGEASESAP